MSGILGEWSCPRPGHETGQLVTQVFFRPLIHLGDESCFTGMVPQLKPQGSRPPKLSHLGRGSFAPAAFPVGKLNKHPFSFPSGVYGGRAHPACAARRCSAAVLVTGMQRFAVSCLGFPICKNKGGGMPFARSDQRENGCKWGGNGEPGDLETPQKRVCKSRSYCNPIFKRKGGFFLLPAGNLIPGGGNKRK